MAAWLARGTGHNEVPIYSEKPEDWINNMNRLDRKFDTARGLVPSPVVDDMDGAKIGILAYGTTMFAINEARDRLAAEGIKSGYMRLRALPINDEVKQFIKRYDRVFVIELNHDGQMRAILQTEVPDMAEKLVCLAHMDGMPLTARWVVEKLKNQME